MDFVWKNACVAGEIIITVKFEKDINNNKITTINETLPILFKPNIFLPGETML